MSVEFLIAFVRNIIRTHPSSDLYELAMHSAMQEVPITKAQQTAFVKAIFHEAEQSDWPKGFF